MLPLLRTAIIPIIILMKPGNNNNKKIKQMILAFQDRFQGIMPPPIIAEYSGQCQCDGRSRTNIQMLVTDLAVIE